MKKIVVPIIILLVMMNLSLVIAVDKPVSDNLFAISQPEALTSGLVGQKCYKDYSTTGEYCSINIREYYQCLPRTGGSEWVFKSENCGTYGQSCKMDDGKATCVSSSASSMPWKTVGIIAGIVFVLYLITKRK